MRVTNSGIAGNTSRDLLARYDRDVVTLNPDWVSICIGINDVWRQFDSPAMPDSHVLPEEYERNVEEMILRVKGKVKGIFILSPYIMEPNREDMMRARMNEYVTICKKLSEKHGCVFVDFQKLYEDYCNIRHSSYIAWDRIHPNQIGAPSWQERFLKNAVLISIDKTKHQPPRLVFFPFRSFFLYFLHNYSLSCSWLSGLRHLLLLFCIISTRSCPFLLVYFPYIFLVLAKIYALRVDKFFIWLYNFPMLIN